MYICSIYSISKDCTCISSRISNCKDNRVRDDLIKSERRKRTGVPDLQFHVDHSWPSRETPSGPLIIFPPPPLVHSFCLYQMISCYFLITSSPLWHALFLFLCWSLLPLGLSDLRREECSSVCQDFPSSQMGQAWSLRPWRGLMTDWQVQVKVD